MLGYTHKENTINIAEIKNLIAAADVCGHVPLIKGRHGVGKSESASQYAKEQDMHFEPLILSLMDTGDMLGLPVTERVNGMMSTLWAAPSWYTNIVNAAWPQKFTLDRLQFMDKDFQEYLLKKDSSPFSGRESLNTAYCEFYKLPNDRLQILRQDNVRNLDSRRSVLFLDEFNRAPSDILNASLQLILDHRLHSHELPLVKGQETLVVAAVNPSDGAYTVQEFDPALLDRFVDCEVTPDLKIWTRWAKENKVNQVVIDFLIENQSKFHFEPKDGSKGASPRSWTRLATYIDRLEDTPKDIMSHYIKGTVGSSLAAQFLMFYTSYGSGMNYQTLRKLVKAAVKKNKDGPIQDTADGIAVVLKDVDAIKKLEYAETFIAEYLGKGKSDEECLPMLVYLYSLPLENLAATLKSMQSSDIALYAKLAKLDKVHNNKALFLKIVSLKRG